MRFNASLTNFKDGASRAHLARYYLARGYVDFGDRVIDAACGTGYGSKLLLNVASNVYGFDQVEKIKHEGVIYKQVDLAKFEDYPQAEVAVSLETLEHLTEDGAKQFVSNLLENTTKFFIFSVPLGEEPGGNPFHQQVFNKNSIWRLVKTDGWAPFHKYMQGNHLIGVMYNENWSM